MPQKNRSTFKAGKLDGVSTDWDERGRQTSSATFRQDTQESPRHRPEALAQWSTRRSTRQRPI
jgi:hypothetical protein